MLQIGDYVVRAVDLNGVFLRKGKIVEISQGVPGHNVTPPTFYTILWDGETVPQKHYMAVGLRKVYTAQQCGLPAMRYY